MTEDVLVAHDTDCPVIIKQNVFVNFLFYFIILPLTWCVKNKVSMVAS